VVDQNSRADEEFREELRTWLSEHLTGEFAQVAGRGSPSDDDAWDVRIEWERELGRGGWIGLAWPRVYGGRQATYAQEVIFSLEYAKAGAPARCTHFGESLLAPTLLAHGTQAQKERFLPPIQLADELWCQGYSEPGAGSDLASVRTTAVPDGEQWRINGQKVWTSFAHHADWIFLLARTDPEAPRHRGISYMLCPIDQPGVEIRPITSLAGRADFNEVFFTDATTAADMVVGPVNNGWAVAMSTLGHERATSVLSYQFSFQREMEVLVDEVRRRGMGKDPMFRHRLAEAAVGLRVMAANNMRTLGRLAREGELGPEASVTKVFWSRWHKAFCELALDVLGPDAMLVDGAEPTGLQRSALMALGETLYAGTTEIQLNIMAERVLGLPREPRLA